MERMAFLARGKKKLPALAAAVLLAAVCFLGGPRLGEAWTELQAGVSASGAQSEAPAGDEALIYYLDVGQADSQLIRLPGGENILIDAGTRAAGDGLTAYLRELGVQRIDILIATHPHEDHIGGMAKVIENFEIGRIYMPKVAESQTPTTRTYEDLLDAIAAKGLKITQAKAGVTVLEDGGAKVELLAPGGGEYDGLNDYSAVTRLTFFEKKFLFTGDAEKDSEKEMVESGRDLKCDVLKCGHHGSSTSTTAAFLKAANPAYAVISCGAGNDYGHPHKEVLARLEKAGVAVYRTDLQGTILARCDGKRITIEANQKSVVLGK